MGMVDLQQQIRSIAEMLIECTVGHARSLSDLLQCRVFDALTAEQLQTGIDQLLSRLGRFFRGSSCHDAGDSLYDIGNGMFSRRP
jgi:hypothetical protein